MSDDCSTCFFSFVAPASAGPFEGKRCCNREAPGPTNSANFLRTPNPGTIPNPWIWPVVEDDFWCGAGAQALDQAAPGKSFASAVNQLPTPQAYSSAAWNAYTPVITAASGTIANAGGSVSYTQLGKSVLFNMEIGMLDNGTGAGYLIATLPIAPLETGACVGLLYDSGAVTEVVGLFDPATGSIDIYTYDGLYPAGVGLTYALYLSGAYQSA